VRPLPVTIVGLLEELEQNYPPRCIGKAETPEDAHRYAGKVELIAELRARINATEKNSKELDRVLT
jgi:hypothetical protein